MPLTARAQIDAAGTSVKHSHEQTRCSLQAPTRKAPNHVWIHLSSTSIVAQYGVLRFDPVKRLDRVLGEALQGAERSEVSFYERRRVV